MSLRQSVCLFICLSDTLTRSRPKQIWKSIRHTRVRCFVSWAQIFLSLIYDLRVPSYFRTFPYDCAEGKWNNNIESRIRDFSFQTNRRWVKLNLLGGGNHVWSSHCFKNSFCLFVRVCVSASAAGIHTVTKVRYLPVSVFTVLPHLTVTRGTKCRVSSRRILLALTHVSDKAWRRTSQ